MHGGFASDQNKSTNVVAEGLRRQQATMTGGASTLDDDTEDYTRAFQTDEQKVFLWHTANRNLQPRAIKPAFRLLGLFASVEEARAHGARIAVADPTSRCAIRLGATHAWYTIPAEMFDDITPHVNKVNRNLAIHQKVLQATRDEFQAHKDQLTEGRRPTAQAHVEAALERTSSLCAASPPARDEGGDGSAPASREPELGVDVDDDDDDDDGGVEETKSVVESASRTPPPPPPTHPSRTCDLESSAVVSVIPRPFNAATGDGDDDGDDTGITLLARIAGAADTQLSASSELEDDAETWGRETRRILGEGGGADGDGDAALHPVPPVVREAEVRNQKYAVVSVLLDYEVLSRQTATAEGRGAGAATEVVEPGVCVWAAFDTESEALRYVKKVAARELPDHDLAVVGMYEWLYPHLMTSDRVPQLYRNVELNNIMKHARTSRTRVSEFEKECSAKGLELPVMEIEPDLEVAAPICYPADLRVI